MALSTLAIMILVLLALLIMIQLLKLSINVLFYAAVMGVIGLLIVDITGFIVGACIGAGYGLYRGLK